LKYIRLEIDDKTGGLPSTALREISILGQLDHLNVIKLHDVFLLQKKCILSFEYVSHDLKALLDAMSPTPLDSFSVKSFIFQLLQGVAYCHRNFIMHRDLKPQNLLVTDDGILKVADFGLARPFSPVLSKYSADVVTLWYRAPELLLGQENYDCSVDIWSIGCIFCELLNNTPPFTGSSEYSQLKAIFSLLGTPEDDGEDDMGNLYTAHIPKKPLPPPPTTATTVKHEELTMIEDRGNVTGVGGAGVKTDRSGGDDDDDDDGVNYRRQQQAALSIYHQLPGYKGFLRHHSKSYVAKEQALIASYRQNDQSVISTPLLPLPFPTHAGDLIMKPIPWQQICPRLQGPGLDLLAKMLTVNPKCRISADEALAHPFFADLAVVESSDYHAKWYVYEFILVF
jgi:serine/threonine protein kinase